MRTSRTTNQPAFTGACTTENKRVTLAALTSLTLLYFSGDVKATILFRWLPVDLTLIAFIASLTLTIRAWAKTKPHRAPPGALLIIWIAWLPAAILASTPYKPILLYTITIFCTIAPTLIRSELCVKQWLQIQVVSAAIVALALITTTPSPAESRLSLEGGTTITLARILGQAILIACLLLMQHPRKTWIWALPVITGFTVLLLQIGSRGPVVALLLALVLGTVLGGISWPRRTLVIFFAAVVVFIIYNWQIHSQTPGSNRILSLFSGESDSSGREILYQYAIDSFSSNPLGIGWGGYANLPEVQTRVGEENTYPHNLVLEIMLEAGWLPSLIVIAIVLSLLLRGFRHAKDDARIIATVCTYWIVSAMFSSDINGNRAMWFTLGLLTTVLAYSRESETQG